MNEDYECQCFKKPLKSCYKFVNNKKNYIKNKAYIIKGSINKEDELVYCASGIFFLRKNKSIEEELKIHTFAITMIRDIFKYGFVNFNDIKNYQVLMIREKRNGIIGYNFLGGKRNMCSEKSKLCALREFREELIESGSTPKKIKLNNDILFISQYKYVLYKSYTKPEYIKIKNTSLKWVNISWLEKKFIHQK